jgi:hypothetical protein
MSRLQVNFGTSCDGIPLEPAVARPVALRRSALASSPRRARAPAVAFICAARRDVSTESRFAAVSTDFLLKSAKSGLSKRCAKIARQHDYDEVLSRLWVREMCPFPCVSSTRTAFPAERRLTSPSLVANSTWPSSHGEDNIWGVKRTTATVARLQRSATNPEGGCSH